jgi:hypothetical protein
MAPVLLLIGVALIVGGAFWVSVPAGVIAVGALFAAAGADLGRNP